MCSQSSKSPWHDKIGNPAQLGGIETSVLDNGPARGLRVAWINTGTPLRYKVVIDRALDIVDAFWGQHSLAWLSHPGITAARPDCHHGLEWLYSFAGGLLTTCGLTHVGGPEADDNEERGLHGRISNIGATVESIVQPDPAAGKLDMSITATTSESSVFGPNLEIRRTISGRLGCPTITIKDVVTNRANTPAPHMLLYHCNFGWPLVDDGADIIWRGKCQPRGLDMDKVLFNSKHNYRKCAEPLDAHRGSGESCGFIDVTPDAKGFCSVGLHNPRLNLALTLTYKKKQFPWLTNWQHWGPGEYVTALEPGTNPPIGQNRCRQEKSLIILQPGRSRTYQTEIAILSDKKQIDTFVKARS